MTSDRSSRLDDDPAFALHRGGKLEVRSTVEVNDQKSLSLAYTPGVARVCTAIADTPELADTYTWKNNVVAVVTDGTAVLGLGDIGPEASLPVMEGKSLLFKQFAGIDSVPIALRAPTSTRLSRRWSAWPRLGGINLEDISAPRCFEIEQAAAERLDIPVFHDDQHGTAIVALAAIRNAASPARTQRACARCLRRRGVRDRGLPHADQGRDRRHRGGRQQGPDLRGAARAQQYKAELAPSATRPVCRGPSSPRWPEPTCVRRPVRGRRCPRRSSPPWPITPSSARWPTPTLRSTPMWPASTRRSWRPGAATSRTRSTTCSPSRVSSAGPWTCGPRRSPRT